MAGAEVRTADELVRAVAATGLLGGAGPRCRAGAGAGTGEGAPGAFPGPGPGTPVLVSCSAGRDSGALLDIAVRVVGAEVVHVLHVDHRLRGVESSSDDESVVRAWCDAAGVGLAVRRADLAAAPVGSAPGNVHAWAREERRRLAAEVAEQVGAARVLVAHTQTDLVETALGRLATQPGRRALLAMRAAEATLVRPLLAAGVSRDETSAYCRERGLVYRDDPSNADRSFARARVRHDVLPVLRSLNPRAEDAVARTLGELAEEAAALDAIVAAELDAAGSGWGDSSGMGGGPGSGVGRGAGAGGLPGPSIAFERLEALPPALARLVLRELCERTLGVPCPGAANRLGDVLALGAAAARQGSGSVDVGGGARLELRGGTVRCVRSAGPAAPS